jgi:chromate transporter
MHDIVVVRRRWLTEREFAATATVSQMLPGGAAANALAYTGLRFFGATGAAVRLERFRRRGRRPSPPLALPEEGAPYPRPPERGPDALGVAALATPGSLASLGAVGTLAAMALGRGRHREAHARTGPAHRDLHRLPRPRARGSALRDGRRVLGAARARHRRRRLARARPLATTGRAALRGLTPAVVGLMAAAALTLGRSLDGPPDLAIAAATLLTLARFRVNPVAVMALRGAVRLALRAAGI